MLHRTRHVFVRQQNAVTNSIRAPLAEFGIVAPVRRNGIEELLDVAVDSDDDRVPKAARNCVAALGAQLRLLKAQILEFDRRMMPWHRSNETVSGWMRSGRWPCISHRPVANPKASNRRCQTPTAGARLMPLASDKFAHKGNP
jgi:hypothetical protein